MKSLLESIFDDNVSKDPFETVLDRMDPEKYSPETAVEALDQLFEIGGKRYGFYSMKGKREEFMKAIQKNNWVMLARKNYDDPIDDYAIEYPWHKNNGLILRFYITWRGKWFCDDFDINFDITKPMGSSELIQRNTNMHYEECILITDKKMVDELKARINKLAA